MSVWSISVDREEIEAVCDVLANLAPLETQGEGVWVRSINGTRVWSVATGKTHWEVDGIALDEPFCDKSECRNFINGVPAYIDDDHLNSVGARMIAEKFSTLFGG